MNENNSADNGSETKKGFTIFAFKRLVIGILLLVAILWALGVVLGYFENPSHMAFKHSAHQPTPAKKAAAGNNSAENNTATNAKADKTVSHVKDEKTSSSIHLASKPAGKNESAAQAESETSGHQNQHDTGRQARNDSAPQANLPAAGSQQVATIENKTAPAESHTQAKENPQAEENGGHAKQPETIHAGKEEIQKPPGVTFVEATIRPLHYELYERFWGWRPNDILDFTDNINNFQLGVLEVTRRTAVVLSERISRTGTNDALDPNLENAMNWFMIKADRYWFPSAESKFKEGLKELDKYKEKLMEGKASFYTRSDNLIPLLSSFEDLLGSCDENLVKAFEEDGSPVSYFKADDYIYYARGVASTMLSILEAVNHDFISILESRHGTELLHHAIESCKRAVEIDPLLVFNSDLDGIFANHRANMAAPISHARFYLGQLIKTLST